MTAKKYLRQIKIADIRINNLISEREQLECLAECVGAISTSDKVISSPRPDKMENAIVKMIEIEMELDNQIKEFINLKREVIKQMEMVGDERYYNILFKRYVEYKDFLCIAKEMKYEYRSVLNLHGKALRKFEEEYPTKQSGYIK